MQTTTNILDIRVMIRARVYINTNVKSGIQSKFGGSMVSRIPYFVIYCSHGSQPEQELLLCCKTTIPYLSMLPPVIILAVSMKHNEKRTSRTFFMMISLLQGADRHRRYKPFWSQYMCGYNHTRSDSGWFRAQRCSSHRSIQWSTDSIQHPATQILDRFIKI